MTKMTKRKRSFKSQEELDRVISRLFITKEPQSIESLLVHLKVTNIEYLELKEKYPRSLEYAELLCKDSIIRAGFDGTNFASYYHKEYFSDVVDVADSRDIVINISRDETVSPHLGLLDE